MSRATAAKSSRKKAASSGKRRIRFEVAAAKDTDVYIAGTFNQWNPTRNKLTFKDGLYTTTLLVPKGRQEYKFIIGGVWCIDPECSAWTPNGLGSLNSVLVVE